MKLLVSLLFIISTLNSFSADELMREFKVSDSISVEIFEDEETFDFYAVVSFKLKKGDNNIFLEAPVNFNNQCGAIKSMKGKIVYSFDEKIFALRTGGMLDYRANENEDMMSSATYEIDENGDIIPGGMITCTALGTNFYRASTHVISNKENHILKVKTDLIINGTPNWTYGITATLK